MRGRMGNEHPATERRVLASRGGRFLWSLLVTCLILEPSFDLNIAATYQIIALFYLFAKSLLSGCRNEGLNFVGETFLIHLFSFRFTCRNINLPIDYKLENKI